MVMVLEERTRCETQAPVPDTVLNWIGNRAMPAHGGETLIKCDPVTGRPLCEVARSARRCAGGDSRSAGNFRGVVFADRGPPRRRPA